MTSPVFAFARWAAVAAAALIGAAMFCYPGGTFRDRSTQGYSWSQNFLSDLGATVAWDGRPNRSSAALFAAGFGLLALSGAIGAVGFVRLHLASPPARRAARVAGTAGVLSCASLLATALTPADRFLFLHVRFSWLALAAAECACLFFALASWSDTRFSRGVTLGWLALSALPAILAATTRWGPGVASDNGLTVQATTQKLASVALLLIGAYQMSQAERVRAR